jgi:uncharacterized protein (DUF697 family)
MDHPSGGTNDQEPETLRVVSDDELTKLTEGTPDPATIVRISAFLARSARAAGATAVATGSWLANTLLDVAPRIPIRDAQTLQEAHDGLSGAALAGELIRKASRASGAIGGVSGAIMSAEEFAPPAWITLPFELVFETIAVAIIELKLVGELHEVYGQPVRGSVGERTGALVRAWAERRGVTRSGKRAGVGESIGRSARSELVRLVRRRLVARLTRNLSSLAPLFAGAVAAAEVNRRATRSLGEAVVRDLAAVRVSAP